MNNQAEYMDPHCLRPHQALAMLEGAPWRRLAVIGDSIAAGVREPLNGYRDLGVADRLRQALEARGPIAYANLARRDLRLTEIINSQLEAALAFAPDLVLVSAGGNDALRRSFDPARVGKQLTHLVAPLRATGATVLLMGLFDLARSGLVPPADAAPMAAALDALDDVTAQVAAELDCGFVDNHSHPAGRAPEIYASDLIHCNARGNAIAGANCIRALHRLLQPELPASPEVQPRAGW